jgi:hypothetical protein
MIRLAHGEYACFTSSGAIRQQYRLLRLDDTPGSGNIEPSSRPVCFSTHYSSNDTPNGTTNIALIDEKFSALMLTPELCEKFRKFIQGTD